ncbi:probable cytochrome P450 6a17 [Wyeomyia smithii]|uniref:probable cytochrome P450 6a17 n=1 Tax=Wyeomyia smithii TaxID=174621 RepID=UPI002467EC1E|nr:probable cytochrome P450 6a17 [Wyeomyia smithii]
MLFYLILLAISLGFYAMGKRYAYWKRRGVPYAEAGFPFGNLKGMRKRHLALLVQDVYVQLKDSGKKFGGMFFFINPVALILDLDFAKDVFIKDFQYFHDRGIYSNEKVDPITAHLVSMEGVKWKNLRAKLTPTFTTGKMKMMYPTVAAVAEEFRKCMLVEAESGGEVEMKEFLARFTTDVIGTCAFGLECNSLKDPEAKFRQMGRKALALTPMGFLRRILSFTFRDLAKALNVRISDPDVADFFMNAVRETIEYREKNNVRRNDFMDLLIKLKNDQPIDDGSEERLGRLTFNEIAAQAFVFFLAGFETSSTAMSYCLYELAQNQELQEKARQDVESVLAKHEGAMTYEAVHEMRYVENCINESLRKYPPVPNILRNTNKSYHVSDMNVTLEKGYRVLLPIYSIHHDARYYPDPERYDPERFNAELTAKRHPMAFIPFGEGPRICIGLRFGMMQARVGLACLLRNFRFKLSPKTPRELRFIASNPLLASEGGLWLHIEKL